MSDRIAEVERIIAADPGKRGIGALVAPGDLAAAAEALLRATSVALVTGFFIPSAKTCETDGPPGVWDLGTALDRVGIDYCYVTDAACMPVLHTAGFAPLCTLADARSRVPAPDCLVAVERPGRGADGNFHSMRGIDISPWTEPLDEWFLNRPNEVTATIGVGDGGNEIGMGKVRERVVRDVPLGATIACVLPTDFLVVAGVSNWGAWGLVAALSLRAGRNLLPTVPQAYAALARLVAAGAVDGVSGQRVCTVDGLPWETHADVLRSLHAVIGEPASAV